MTKQPEIKPRQIWASHEGRRIHILLVDSAIGVQYLEDSLFGADFKYMPAVKLRKNFSLQGEAKATLADVFTTKD